MSLPPNVFGYAAPVWSRFATPRHAGELAGAGVIAAEAGSRSARALLRLTLRIGQGRILEARFRAYGCPSAIAVGEWLAERLNGQAVETLHSPDFNAPAIRQALEIAEDRAHCALLGEDVVRALLKQM